MNDRKTDKTRVAVYIRIGGTGECNTAFEAQKLHFAEIISQNPEWELVQIYADLGTDSRKQPNLGRLMADCKAGCVDLVVTKSTSRMTVIAQRLNETNIPTCSGGTWNATRVGALIGNEKLTGNSLLQKKIHR